MKGRTSWSNVEGVVAGLAGSAYLAKPIMGWRTEDGKGRGCGREKIKQAVDLHEHIAYKVGSRPGRRLEDSRIIRFEPDAPDEVVRISFSKDLVAGVHKLT